MQWFTRVLGAIDVVGKGISYLLLTQLFSNTRHLMWIPDQDTLSAPLHQSLSLPL
jgi:hypothetical protein